MIGTAFRSAAMIFVLFIFSNSANAGAILYCNLAPYDKEIIVLQGASGAYKDHPITKTLVAGGCDTFQLDQPTGSRLYYYVRGSDTRSLRKLRQDSAFVERWGDWPIWSSADDTNPVCVSPATGAFIGSPMDDQCANSAILINPYEVEFDENGDYRLWSVDYNICDLDIDVDCEGDYAPILQWAYLLNVSLDASMRSFEIEQNDGYYGVIPTALGWEVDDLNGPYRKGAVVTFSYNSTPLGSPIHVANGDIVLEFNDQPVFDRDDLVYYVILHGLNSGYEEPYRVLIERNGKEILYEGFQVFHRDSFGRFFLGEDGRCRNATAASITGALREASFYTSHILGCLNFDQDNQPERNRQCEFTVKQVAAAYRQFCPNQTFYATIIGGIFMPGRQIPEDMLSRYLFKGLRAPARIMRAVTIEGAEEAVRAALTLPPGFTAMSKLGDIREQAAIGAAMGAGFTIAFPRGLAPRQ